jgi:hypothetical protein
MRAVVTVLTRPKFAAIAVLTALLALSVLIWLFAFEALVYVLTLPGLAAGDKALFVLSAYTNSLLYIDDPIVFTRVVFAILAGISFGMYWLIRSHRQVAKIPRNLGGFTVALVSAGCVACSTSLLAPLLAALGASLSVTASISIGVAGNVIGIILMLYAIRGLSIQIDSTSRDSKTAQPASTVR